MAPFIIIIIAVLLIVATSIALWWWRMSARIAPYADERERAATRALAHRPKDEHVVVVVTCPPKSDPATMRVPTGRGSAQETLDDEADKAFGGTDCVQVA